MLLYNETVDKIGCDFEEKKQGVELGINFLSLCDLGSNFFKLREISLSERAIHKYTNVSQVNYSSAFSSNELSANPIQITKIPEGPDVYLGSFVVELESEVLAVLESNALPHVYLESNKVKFDLEHIKPGTVFCVVSCESDEQIRIEFDVKVEDGIKKVVNFRKLNTEGVEYKTNDNAQIALKVKNFRLNPEYDTGRNKTDKKTNLSSLLFSWDPLKKSDHFLLEIVDGGKIYKSKMVGSKTLGENPFCILSMPSRDGKYEVFITPFKGGKRGESTSVEVGCYRKFNLNIRGKSWDRIGIERSSEGSWVHYNAVIPIISADNDLEVFNLEYIKAKLSNFRGSSINTDKWCRGIDARIDSASLDGHNLNIRFSTFISFKIGEFLSEITYSLLDVSVFDFVVHLVSDFPLEDSVGNTIQGIDTSFHVPNPYWMALYEDTKDILKDISSK